MQMVLAGCSNPKIAEQRGIKTDTAKTHLRTVTQKMSVKSRSSLVARVVDVMERIDPEEYRKASGGLPLDWRSTARLLGQRDPYAGLYRTS